MNKKQTLNLIFSKLNGFISLHNTITNDKSVAERIIVSKELLEISDKFIDCRINIRITFCGFEMISLKNIINFNIKKFMNH
jgi:hypothetical protein